MQPSPGLLELIRAEAKRCAAKIQDSGGRNPLLYRRGARLDLDRFDEQVAVSFLAGRESALLRHLIDESQTAVVRRLLQRLLKRAKEFSEEQGLDVLSVAFGLVKIKKAGTESSDLEAPLVLLPATLTFDAGTDDFKLMRGGDPSINLSLVRFLERERDIHLRSETDALVDSQENESPVNVRDGFVALLRRAGLDPEFELDYRSLALFTFAQEALVQDLEEDIEYLAQHDLIAALAGDASAEARVNDVEAPIQPADLDSLSFTDEPLALPADSSQRIEIAVALRGDHTVIEGPPGTGKSQTIANLIVALAARGKTTLFVAEKRAALEAVQRRLESAGLGHLVMDLHRSRDQKSAAYRQIAETWAQVDPSMRTAQVVLPTDVTSPAVLRERDDLRDRLNARAQVMSQEAAPGMSFGALFALAGGVRESALRELAPLKISADTLDEIGSRLEAAVTDLFYVGGLPLVLGEHPFAGLDVGGDTRKLGAALEAAQGALQLLSSSGDAVGLVDGPGLLARPLGLIRISEEFRGLDLSAIEQLGPRLRGAAPLGWPAPARWVALVKKELRAVWGDLRRSGPGVPASQIYKLSARATEWLTNWKADDTTRGVDPQIVADSVLPESASTFIESREVILGHFSTEAPPPLGGSAAAAASWIGASVKDIGLLPSLAGAVESLRELRASGASAALRASSRVSDAGTARTELRRILAGKFLQDLRQAGAWPDPLNWPGERLADLRADFCARDVDVESGAGVLAQWASHARAVAALEAARQKRIRIPNRSQKGYAETTQYDLLKREAGKQRAHLSLRTLLRATGEAAVSLRPCWAMSPLTVSQVLPRRQLFDVVIFDEASQVDAPVALPAIARGRQAVVAGDSMQLPPSPFFKKFWVADEEEGEWTEPPEDVDELQAVPSPTSESSQEAQGEPESPHRSALTGMSVLLTSESILQAVGLKLRRVGSLKWHYRSRDERLIAFSNAFIYRRLGRPLLTFPSPSMESPVTFEHVPSSRGEARTAGASSREIDALLDCAAQVMKDHPKESLGVITFNVKTVELFDAALRERVKSVTDGGEEPFAAMFDDEKFEPFFCKSIEQVQGDERDSIILHVPAYFTKADKLKAWFGLINSSGGERRLNVAATRARRRMSVISAIAPEDLAGMQFAPGSGPEFLRGFLTYVASGGKLDSATVGSRPDLNFFEMSVKEGLERRGHVVEGQVGSIGYLVDLAIRHPDRPGYLALGIECDGASWHSERAARDRDRLRQEQLEDIGWRIFRIWSTDWFRDPESQLDLVEAELQKALRQGYGVMSAE